MPVTCFGHSAVERRSCSSAIASFWTGACFLLWIKSLSVPLHNYFLASWGIFLSHLGTLRKIWYNLWEVIHSAMGEGFGVRAFDGLWKNDARQPATYKGFELIVMLYHPSWICCVCSAILYNLHIKLYAASIYGRISPHAFLSQWAWVCFEGSYLEARPVRNISIPSIKLPELLRRWNISYANIIKLESFWSSFLAHKVSVCIL